MVFSLTDKFQGFRLATKNEIKSTTQIFTYIYIYIYVYIIYIHARMHTHTDTHCNMLVDVCLLTIIWLHKEAAVLVDHR